MRGDDVCECRLAQACTTAATCSVSVAAAQRVRCTTRNDLAVRSAAGSWRCCSTRVRPRVASQPPWPRRQPAALRPRRPAACCRRACPPTVTNIAAINEASGHTRMDTGVERVSERWGGNDAMPTYGFPSELLLPTKEPPSDLTHETTPCAGEDVTPLVTRGMQLPLTFRLMASELSRSVNDAGAYLSTHSSVSMRVTGRWVLDPAGSCHSQRTSTYSHHRAATHRCTRTQRHGLHVQRPSECH